MGKAFGAAAFALVLLGVSGAQGQEQAATVWAHRAATDLVQMLTNQQMLEAFLRTETSDYPDLPACAEIQRRSLRVELSAAQGILTQAIGDSMIAQFTPDELAVGVRFLEGPAAQETLAANRATRDGQRRPLSPEAQREMRILGSLPEFRSFLGKLQGALSGPLVRQRMKDEFDPLWKQRFAAMAAAAAVSCPARDWKD